MDHSPHAVPAPERAPADRLTPWTSPLSPAPALPNGPERPRRDQITHIPVSLAGTRLSEAIEFAWSPNDEGCGNVAPTTTPESTPSPIPMTPAGKAHPQPLFPTYIGCLETKKDALLLLEGCFRGQLHHSFRGPPTVPLIIRSGSVFIWEQNVSASQHWDDHRSWTILDHVDDFWISSETTTGDGFWKLTLSVLALGRVYHIVSYYCPWDTVTGNLQAPSQDPNLRCMTLRDELASQLTADSPSARSFRLLRGILKACSPTGHVQLMRSALLLCLFFADEVRHDCLMQRRPGDWFPHIPSSPTYWRELSHRDLFLGTTPGELRRQMEILLVRLIDFANSRTSSQLLRNQPSDAFSAIQNRSLYREIFRVRDTTPLSRRPVDSASLARSVLFYPNSKIDSMRVEKWAFGLAQALPIDPPVLVEVSPHMVGVLEQVSLRDSDNIRMLSLDYCHQFPRFSGTKNSQPLFLVACQSTSISTEFTELLRDWAISDDAYNTYQCLLKALRGSLPPDELTLNLAALVLIHYMSGTIERDSTEPPRRVRLIDIHYLLNGDSTIHNRQAILREAIWSLSRAISRAFSPGRQAPYLRVLHPVQAAVSVLGQSRDTSVDNYWMTRLLHSLSHADAWAQVIKDARSTSVSPDTSDQFGVLVSGKAGDETRNCNSVSSGVGTTPPVKFTHEQDGVHCRGGGRS